MQVFSDVWIKALRKAGIKGQTLRRVQAVMLANSTHPDETLQAISAMDSGTRQRIVATKSGYQSVTSSVLSRARTELLSMPDSEWEAMVDEANNGRHNDKG